MTDDIASLRASVERLTRERDASIAVAEGLSRTQGAPVPSLVLDELRDLRHRAESAEATIARLGMVVRAARELRTNYEDLIIGEWGPFDGPFRDEFTKPFDAALASLTPEDRRRVGIEG